MAFSVASDRVQEMIEREAQRRKIPLQRTVLTQQSYATDATSVPWSGTGVPVAILAVPRRYAHSPVEVFSLDDAARSAQIVLGLVEHNGEVPLAFL